MSKTILSLITIFIFAQSAVAQKELLQSGPMVGYSTMKEVALWVQTTKPASVQFRYWTVDNPKEKFETEKKQTVSLNAFAITLIANQVLPGHQYHYELIINDKAAEFDYDLRFQSQTLWQHRTDPPSFKFAAGSCSYINEPAYDRPNEEYGGGYEIFKTIHSKKPDFMLWLGDNMYLREADWNSRTGIFHRFTHTRSCKEMQPLLGASHHYAIWDDHDFGPNNSDRSFWNKEITKEAFKTFWPAVSHVNEGITQTFWWADTQFFLLDNRYFRSPNNRTTGERAILGAEQERWLIDALKSSNAPFKFVAVGGQFISNYADFENHATFAEERNRIIQKIREERIEGVVFLSGDRHHTELSMLRESPEVYPIYDFTISPLTAGTHITRDESNTLRVEGTLVNERNFAEVEVSGQRRDRKLTVKIFNKDGKLLWTKELRAKELRYKY